MTDQTEIYTLTEVCAWLKISRSTAYRLIRIGRLPAFHVGRKHRVTSTALERLANSRDIYVPSSRAT